MAGHRRLDLRIGIDKDQGLAALQHVLVDGELRRVGELLRMHHHQHVDIGRDLVDVGRQSLDIVDLAQLADDRQRLALLALQRRGRVNNKRQRAHQPDHRALREGERVDQPRQIVFEKPLALGVEERDDLLVVGRVGAGEAEIDRLALVVERHGLQPIGDGAVLGVGKRLRIVDFEPQLAFGGGDILVEQLAHALGIDAIGRRAVAEPVRVIEAQRDRLLDLGEGLPRAAGQRVEVLRGQVEAQRAVASHHDIARDEDQRDRGERQQRAAAPRGEPAHHSAFIRSMSTALAPRKATISETK